MVIGGDSRIMDSRRWLHDLVMPIDFPANNNTSISFKFKQQIAGQTGKGSTKDVEVMVPLKYLSNFWRTLERTLINCEFSLQFFSRWYCSR